MEEKNLYFYHPDHLGSSSYITDKNGEVIQHTEYIAFGETFVDEHSVSPTQPYLFNGKELDYETGLYYYGERYYDPKTSIFLNVDPLVEKTGTPYAYTYNNPINLIDPTGMEAEKVDYIEVEKQKNGTYKVVGGKADADKNVYVVENGKRTGQVLGQMLTEYSFHGDDGEAIIDAIINLKDKSGQTFFNNEIRNINIFDYMPNATGGQPLDFKIRNLPERLTKKEKEQYVYRGMPFEGKIASARDIGNYAAGYVAASHGMSWDTARFGFDALETKQKEGFWKTLLLYPFNRVNEGQPTQRAERAGHKMGYPIFKQRQFEREWKNATNPYPSGPKW